MRAENKHQYGEIYKKLNALIAVDSLKYPDKIEFESNKSDTPLEVEVSYRDNAGNSATTLPVAGSLTSKLSPLRAAIHAPPTWALVLRSDGSRKRCSGFMPDPSPFEQSAPKSLAVAPTLRPCGEPDPENFRLCCFCSPDEESTRRSAEAGAGEIAGDEESWR